MNAIELNANKGKFLAAIMVFAMIIAGAAIINGSVSAVDTQGDISAMEPTEGGLVLEAGVYSWNGDISKDLEIRPAVTDGNVADVTILVGDAASVSAGNVTISDLTIGAASAAASDVLGINIYGVDTAVTFDNVTFDASFANHTIYINAGVDVTVQNSAVENAKFVYEANTVPGSIEFVRSSGSDLAVVAGVEGAETSIGSDIIVDRYSTFATVTVDSPVTNTVLNIPADADLVVTGDISNAGTINVYGSLEAVNVINAEGANFYYTADADINAKVDGKDINTQWSDIPLDGAVIDASSSINGSPSQRIIINGDVTVIAGGEINVRGQLVVSEGATLTLEAGAKISLTELATAQIDGDVVIEGGTDGATFVFDGSDMIVNGSVTLEGMDAFESTGKVTVNGTFTISEEASADLNNAVVAEGGILDITGVITGQNISNAGTITIDSEGVVSGEEPNTSIEESDVGIVMQNGGLVDIVNVIGKVVVSDADGNSVEVEDINGIQFNESVETVEEQDVCTLYMTGNVSSASTYDNTDATASIIVSGPKVEVAENMTINCDADLKDIGMTVNGQLTVSADLTAYDMPAISGSGAITVSGKVTVSEAIATGVNAARYQTEDRAYVYTTLATAIDDAATDIDVFGAITVDSDVTIPVGTTVDMQSGSEITISEDVTLTVAGEGRNSAKLNTDGNVIVDGTLVVNVLNRSGVDENDVVSDTSRASGDSMSYTNIYNALESAAEGETVEITRGTPVELDRDLTVPAGRTLSISGTESVIVLNDVTMTVAGTVSITGNGDLSWAPEVPETATEAAKAAGAIVVTDGMIVAPDTTKFVGKVTGAYYAYNRADVISSLATAIGIINDIESADIILNGDMELTDADFSGYTGTGLTVVVNGVTSFGTFTMGAVAFQAVGAVTGTVALANGDVELDNILGVTLMDVENRDVVVSTLSGHASALDNLDTLEVVETGSIVISGEVSVESSTAAQVSVDIASGATATIGVANFQGPVAVNGTMVIGTAGSVFDTVTVLGTVSIAEGVAASAVNDVLYVGVTEDDIALGGAATVDGLRVVGNAVAYVSPESTVGESITGLKATAYNVDDALYVTAYTAGTVAVNELDMQVENAIFNGWVDADGNAVPDTTTIGTENYETVYADINYNIYDVTVIADNGIGTVAIDGVVLQKVSNMFVAENLTAGTHTISYTLKNGYEGEAQMTVGGVAASGYTFELSGTTQADRNVTITLSGTTVATQDPVVIDDGSDGMGITEYLLIILVVLVIILAIFVALRMMRS